ncbi:MAG: hypothetical protein LBU80_07235 [Rikenellaceae bacterium]|jgi:hypothetical protein|nr:hypothetical protein [Rikenellaceae bacterium]
MKGAFLFAVVAAVMLAATGARAQGRSWRKTEDPWARKNSVTALGSAQGWGKYHSWGFGHVGLEYDRMLRGGLSVSAIGLYAPMNGNTIEDAYVQEETMTFAGAKVNYNIPVVQGWLYFRFGLGGGVGYHKATSIDMGWVEPPEEPVTRPALDTYVKPHLMVDAYWVLRATRWLDLRFSPLILSPSQIIVGGKFNAPYNDSAFRYFNMGTLGATARF